MNTKLVYVGADAASRDITGTRISNMFLNGSRRRMSCDSATAPPPRSWSTRVIQWCGMSPQGDDSSKYKYHNAEGVYVGTSPKSTDQPLYANDTSNGIVVRDSHHQHLRRRVLRREGERALQPDRGQRLRVQRRAAVVQRQQHRAARRPQPDPAHQGARQPELERQAGVGLRRSTTRAATRSSRTTSQAPTARAIRSEQSIADSRYCANTFAATAVRRGSGAIGDPRQSCSGSTPRCPPSRSPARPTERRCGHGPDHRRRRRQRHRDPRRVRRRRSADRHRQRPHRGARTGRCPARPARTRSPHGLRRRRQRRHRRGRRHGRHHHPAHVDQRRRHHDARADRADDRLRGGVGHLYLADGARLRAAAQGGQYVVQTSGSGTGRSPTASPSRPPRPTFSPTAPSPRARRATSSPTPSTAARRRCRPCRAAPAPTGPGSPAPRST